MIYDANGDEVPEFQRQLGFVERWKPKDRGEMSVQGGQFIRPEPIPLNDEQRMSGPWCRRGK